MTSLADLIARAAGPGASAALLLDGAMGTMLQSAGLDDGGAPELWNVERADDVAAIHRAYLEAGSRVVTTNTFGGSRPRLAMHGLEDRVGELNAAAARLAKNVAEPFGALVAGDLGPLGELMEPMGDLTPEQAQELFAEQVRGLVEGGIDLVVIETMSDLAEVEAAVRAVQQVAQESGTDLPIVATMSFDTKLRTMMGVSPALAVTTLAPLGVGAVGANCGRGPEEMEAIMAEMATVRPEGLLLVAQSNAGLPQLQGDVFVYDATPQDMADHAARLAALGIDLVGACCGSTAAHIAAMGDALSSEVARS